MRRHKSALAHAVIALREKAHLSQLELAEGAGLGLSTVERVERGERVARATIRALANFFGEAPDALFALQGAPAATQQPRLHEARRFTSNLSDLASGVVTEAFAVHLDRLDRTGRSFASDRTLFVGAGYGGFVLRLRVESA